MVLNRQLYQHMQYIKRKFRGLTPEQIKTAQLREDQLRSQRAIKRHKFWLNRYNKSQPGLYTLFTEMSFIQRELICSRLRRDAAMLETSKEAKLGLFVEKTYNVIERKKQKC